MKRDSRNLSSEKTSPDLLLCANIPLATLNGLPDCFLMNEVCIPDCHPNNLFFKACFRVFPALPPTV